MLEELLIIYPDKSWDWVTLSNNPNITWEFIKENSNFPWDWYWISTNAKITWEIILANPKYPWNWHGISKNPNITWEIIQTNPGKNWDWYYISSNPNITWEIIQANPTKRWDWNRLSEHPNITWEIIQNHSYSGWNWYFVSRNPNITPEIIQANPNKRWNKSFIKNNITQEKYDINCKILDNEINNSNNIKHLSKYATWDQIKKYDYIRWDFNTMSINRNLSINIIKENIFLNWDWNILTLNTSISILDILNNNLTWNYYVLHEREDFKLEYISQYPNIKLSWKEISKKLSRNDFLQYKKYLGKSVFVNPNISFYEIVKEKYIDFKLLSENLFNHSEYYSEFKRSDIEIDEYQEDILCNELLYIIFEYVNSGITNFVCKNWYSLNKCNLINVNEMTFEQRVWAEGFKHNKLEINELVFRIINKEI